MNGLSDIVGFLEDGFLFRQISILNLLDTLMNLFFEVVSLCILDFGNANIYLWNAVKGGYSYLIILIVVIIIKYAKRGLRF